MKSLKKSENDICTSIDARIQTVCTELREGLATTKKDIQISITTLERATASHEEIIKELEKRSSLHSDDITALQCQVMRMNSEVGKLKEKCEDLEVRSTLESSELQRDWKAPSLASL